MQSTAQWLQGRPVLVTIDTQVETLDGGQLEIAGTSAAVPRIAQLCKGFRLRSCVQGRSVGTLRRACSPTVRPISGLYERGEAEMADIGVALTTVGEIEAELSSIRR
jgi:hypothetical protein